MVYPDRVLSFVREARQAARRTGESMRLLSLVKGAPDERALAQNTASSGPHDDAIEALRTKDDELVAAAEELRAQIETLVRATALLERERSKYLDLFVHAPDAYVVTDLNGKVEDANVATGTLLHTEPHYFVGRPLISFVARQDTRTFRDYLRDLGGAKTQDGPGEISLRMRPRGQSVMTVRLHGRIVRGASDRPIAVRFALHPQ